MKHRNTISGGLISLLIDALVKTNSLSTANELHIGRSQEHNSLSSAMISTLDVLTRKIV
ncbi:hypothetical protein APU01nite_07490 [Alkalibacterium putridalgicola]|uniref:Uncharacterized protein n=1 Tax=Alkalibacterium putridalgicola TaxID=426703 RepID=A0ABQ0UW03_9LACT|nr:hypothetical protein APU01nite_07490 [Alkalibacterium putridalgicola]